MRSTASHGGRSGWPRVLLNRYNTRPAMACSFILHFRIARFGSSDERVLQSAAAAAITGFGISTQARHDMFHQTLGLVRVLQQHLDDLLNGHVVVIRVPAVIVGDHGHGGVAQLGLARELGFGHVGHADHVAAPSGGTARIRRGC